MNTDTPISHHYAIYGYEPGAGYPYVGEGHRLAVDLVTTWADDIGTTAIAADIDPADELVARHHAEAHAEAHGYAVPQWSTEPEDVSDSSGAYLAVGKL